MNSVNLYSDWSISRVVSDWSKLQIDETENRSKGSFGSLQNLIVSIILYDSYHMTHTIWLTWYEYFRLYVQVYIGSFGHEEWPLFLGHPLTLNSHLFPGRINRMLFSFDAPPGGETFDQFYHDGQVLEIALFEF